MELSYISRTRVPRALIVHTTYVDRHSPPFCGIASNLCLLIQPSLNPNLCATHCQAALCSGPEMWGLGRALLRVDRPNGPQRQHMHRRFGSIQAILTELCDGSAAVQGKNVSLLPQASTYFAGADGSWKPTTFLPARGPNTSSERREKWEKPLPGSRLVGDACVCGRFTGRRMRVLVRRCWGGRGRRRCRLRAGPGRWGCSRGRARGRAPGRSDQRQR